ncbi:MAG TPA: retropepsin-like aspartic protease [Pyrinomonadaceae bacterium]|nr:retropepsin-like aspartic protease [Pyrinomonadaceae bacterium]
MKHYIVPTMRMVFFSVLVPMLLTLSEPLQTNAQQSGKGTSARKLQQAAPMVRFDSGDSALKIPLDIDNSIIRMEVRVNHSKPLKFIFDTGASFSVISSRRAAELGLKSQGVAQGNATGGRIKGSYTKGVSLSVQGAEVSNQLIASIQINTPPGFDFDGILGQNFIEQFVVEIDYENKIMNLYNPRTYTYSGKGEVIPLLLAAGKTPLVNTKIILEGRAPVEARLELDTGADGTFVINSPFVKKQKLAEAVLKTGQSNNNGAGGEQSLLVGRVKAVQLGRLVFDNPPVGLSQDTEGSGASEENDGVIGGEIFRRFKVILDYSRKRMILEPNKSFNDPYNVETSGI